MGSFLVVYGSSGGQTAAVARYVERILADRGHHVTTEHVYDTAGLSVEDFDAVLVGSPVINRAHLPEVVEFVDSNSEALAERPSGFFQLSMASAMPFTSAQQGAREWVAALVEETGWQPDRVGVFAGALEYSRYSPLERALFRMVAAVTTGDTDTSRDYEYTDWDEVARFTTSFASVAERQLRGTGAGGWVGRVVDSGGVTAARRVARAGAIGLATGFLSAHLWHAVRERSASDAGEELESTRIDVPTSRRSP